MNTTRRVRRTAFAAALLAAAMTVPATAQDISADGTPAVHTGNLSAYDRVADFYGAYIDAVYDSGHGRLAPGWRPGNARMTPTACSGPRARQRPGR